MFLMSGPELMKEKKNKKEKKGNKNKKDNKDKRKEEKEFVLYPDDMSLADLSLKPVISI